MSWYYLDACKDREGYEKQQFYIQDDILGYTLELIFLGKSWYAFSV